MVSREITNQVMGRLLWLLVFALCVQIFPGQEVLAQPWRGPSPRASSPVAGTSLDEAQLQQIWDALKSASHVWRYIEDRAAKTYFVEQYIKLFQRKRVIIRKPASHYVDMINEMAANTPSMLRLPFIKILQIVAVMEYDFDFGQDQDSFARRILGVEAYQQNRQRLGLD